MYGGTGSNSMKTGSIDVTTGSLNVIIGTKNVEAGSKNMEARSKNVETGSLDLVTGSLNATTGSLNATNGSLDVINGSLDATNGSHKMTTESLNLTTGSLNVTTGSLHARTGSLSVTTENLDATTGSLNLTTGSLDVSDKKAVLELVMEYYGNVLSASADIKTSVCITAQAQTHIPLPVQVALRDVHPEVKNRFYGCGTVLPPGLHGAHVLDLGSGSGQDCYVLSRLVGQTGQVVGLDMTEEQLAISRRYIEYHTDIYGYSRPNVRFVNGFMERLSDAGLEDASFDLLVSNCVFSLSPDKHALLSEAFRVLKVGGELYFSAIFAENPVPDEVRQHKVLWGEGIGGALWWRDLEPLCRRVGFMTPRVFTAFTYNIDNQRLEAVVGDRQFASVTYRLFKPPAKPERPCKATYKGTIKGYEDSVILDHSNTFHVGRPLAVSQDVATILKTSRLRDHFRFQPRDPGTSGRTKDVQMNPFHLAAELGNTPRACKARSAATCSLPCRQPQL